MAITRIDKRTLTHEQWLERRLDGLGSSDAAAAAGFSRFGTPYQLWLEKTRQVQSKDLRQNPYVYWGTMHEPTIAREFASRHPEWSVRNTNFMFVNDEHGFNMISDVDRLVRRPGEAPAILECKTASHDEGWGDPGGADVPEEYYLQVQHQMATLGQRYNQVYLAVLIRGVDFREYVIPRDDEMIKNLAVIEKDFMQKVVTMTPPPAVDLDDVKLKWKAGGEAVEATPDIARLARRLKKISRLSNQLEKMDETARVELANYMGEAGVLKIDGEKALTYKTQESNRLDQKALSEAHPDLVAQYRKNSTSRVLRFT